MARVAVTDRQACPNGPRSHLLAVTGAHPCQCRFRYGQQAVFLASSIREVPGETCDSKGAMRSEEEFEHVGFVFHRLVSPRGFRHDKSEPRHSVRVNPIARANERKDDFYARGPDSLTTFGSGTPSRAPTWVRHWAPSSKARPPACTIGRIKSGGTDTT